MYTRKIKCTNDSSSKSCLNDIEFLLFFLTVNDVNIVLFNLTVTQSYEKKDESISRT